MSEEPTEETDHLELTADLDESDMEALRHGSNVTFEWQDGDKPLAVTVGREDKELDEDWLLDRDEEAAGGVSRREWKTIGAIALVILGAFQATGPLVPVLPMFVGGILAVLGGILIIELVREADANAV